MTTPIRASLSQALLKPNPSQASNTQASNPLAAQKAFFQNITKPAQPLGNISAPKPNLRTQINPVAPHIVPPTYTSKDIEKASPSLQNQPLETILRPGSRLNIVV